MYNNNFTYFLDAFCQSNITELVEAFWHIYYRKVRWRGLENLNLREKFVGDSTQFIMVKQSILLGRMYFCFLDTIMIQIVRLIMIKQSLWLLYETNGISVFGRVIIAEQRNCCQIVWNNMLINAIMLKDQNVRQHFYFSNSNL